MDHLTPGIFRNGKSAKNRIVIPPMASETADSKGIATDKTLRHYQRLSEADVGIIFVEYSFIHQSGKGEPYQLGIDSDRNIDNLAKIAELIHEAGSLAGIQLVHVGGKTTTAISGFTPMGPSAVAVPAKGWDPEMPMAMSLDDIQNWSIWFLEAAKRADAAGFDFVELHAAHGYGLNQWLSPLTNRRGDTYGGSIGQRAKLLLDIVRLIRRELPHLLLAVRLPAQDHFLGGLERKDMAWVVLQLQKSGVDLIDVSSGIGGWQRPVTRSGEGYLVDDAAFLKAHLTIPVIGVGGIETRTFIDKIINEQRVDFAAVGRAILRDPRAWRNLVEPSFVAQGAL